MEVAYGSLFVDQLFVQVLDLEEGLLQLCLKAIFVLVG